MGGRGSSGGSGKTVGGGSGNIPKITKSEVGKLSRSEVEKVALAIFSENGVKSGLSQSEASYRGRSLMSGNTTAQLKKYILKHQ